MTPNIQPVVWPRLILFGDSLTQYCFTTEGGWGSIVAAAFERRLDVVARGFSGYNTRMCKYILPRIFGSKDADTTAAFVVLLGANDSSCRTYGGQQVVPVDEYTQNLGDILQHLKTCGVPENKVVLVTPPPANHEAWAARCKMLGRPLSYRSLDVTSKYAQACINLGHQRKVQVVDLFTEFCKEPDWKKLFQDGLHFSRAGSEKLASLLLPFLEEAVGQLPSLFPYWGDVDQECPQKTLVSWTAAECSIAK